MPGELRLSRLNAAVTEFRRHWRGLLAARPEGFHWLKVAGRELTGVTVAGLDATIARRLALDHRPDQRLAGGQCPARTGLTKLPTTRKRPGRTVETGAPGATAGPRTCPRTRQHDQKAGTVIKERSPSPR